MKRGTTAGLYLWGGAAVLAALAGLAVLAWGDGTSGRYVAGGLLLAAAGTDCERTAMKKARPLGVGLLVIR